jgi:hypothetical protein
MLTEDLKYTPPEIMMAITMNTATYPEINITNGYMLFLYFEVHPDKRETAAILVVKGQGCIVVINPSIKQLAADNNIPAILFS